VSSGPSSQSHSVRLNLKELLNVSSDWKEINKKNIGNSPSYLGGVPTDFQSQQIDKIVEAIALILPSGLVNSSFNGGIGGTLSTNND